METKNFSQALPAPNVEHHQDALKHAWSWVSVYSSQRMSSIYFFLIAASFLTQGYLSACGAGNYGLAAGVAALGLSFTVTLAVLEHHSRHYLRQGERAMLRAEVVLGNQTETDAFSILRHINESSGRALHERASMGLFISSGVSSIIAGVAAVMLAVHQNRV